MVLSDGEIKQAIANGEIGISGVEKLHIGPSSLDLHLSNKVVEMINGKQIDVSKDNSYMFKNYTMGDGLVIEPGAFYLLSSTEKIKFSDGIVGFVQGRSSLARLGLQIHCAGFVDAGFEGTITLEVVNFTQTPIYIPVNTRICQMVFVRMGKPAEVNYANKKDAKYQGQVEPTITRIYQDYQNEK